MHRRARTRATHVATVSTTASPTVSAAVSTENLADYNVALGNMLALPPNLKETFTDVVAQVFPLKADAAIMQKFLDDYLNCPADKENPPVYFKAAAPFVLLEIVNYASMASNTPHVGWFAQHEIAFGIPLEWYAREGDNLKFLKYAIIYPYIYVDNALSLRGGREIYGWSKAPIEIEARAPVFEPATSRTLLSAKLLFPGDSPDVANDSENLLRIVQTRYFQTAVSSIPDIFTAVPRAISASVVAAFDLLKLAGGATSGATGSQISSLQSLLPKFYRKVGQYLPQGLIPNSMASVPPDSANPPVSLITFKQVREVEDPNQTFQSLACYQGIVESRMQVDRLKDGGLLIDAVSPDSSGGIYIDLWKENPDVLKLGIVSQEVDTGKDDWGKLRRVTPILPFWIKMDLSYGLADYQVWRTNLTSWTSNNTPQLRPSPKQFTYIDLDSGATQEIAPPRSFPAVTQRILPLQAETAVLDRLLAGYLDNDQYRFESIGRLGDMGVVCLILSGFAKMRLAGEKTKDIDSEAGYSDYELTFAIPARWTRASDKVSGECLIPAYSFVGTYWNAITTSEVYGRVAFKSTFVDPPFTSNLPPEKDNIRGRNRKSRCHSDDRDLPSEDRTQPLKHLPLLQIYSTYAPDNPSGVVLQQPKRTVEEFLTGIGLPAYRSAEKRIHSIAQGGPPLRSAAFPGSSADPFEWSGWIERPEFVMHFPMNVRQNLDPTAGVIIYKAKPGPAMMPRVRWSR